MLASSAMMEASNDKEAAHICFQIVDLEEDKYRLGHTKLFFRYDILSDLYNTQYLSTDS